MEEPVFYQPNYIPYSPDEDSFLSMARPFFCPIYDKDFGENLFGRLSQHHYLDEGVVTGCDYFIFGTDCTPSGVKSDYRGAIEALGGEFVFGYPLCRENDYFLFPEIKFNERVRGLIFIIDAEGENFILKTRALEGEEANWVNENLKKKIR